MTTSKMRAFALAEQKRRRQAEDQLAKAMNLVRGGRVKTAMAAPSVFTRFPHVKEKLEQGVESEALLMMTDLSPFSQVVSGWKAHLIRSFLDEYYRLVVEQVVKANGVVEKYIGDAVISAFGDPFEEETTVDRLHAVVSLAQTLADMVDAAFGGEVSAKSAIAFGRCFVGFVGPSEHCELTIIGTPLTQLFRLEDKCPPSGIILPQELFDQVRDRYQIRNPIDWLMHGVNPRWRLDHDVLDLRGVGSLPVCILTRSSPIV